MHFILVTLILLVSGTTAIAQSRTTPPPTPKDVSGPPLDADQSITGLASKVLKAGTGTAYPEAKSTVTVHYTGWTTDGRVFDSSYSRGQPASFKLDQVIRGWTEGLQLMKVGAKYEFFIHPKIAYGQRARPKIPANSVLIFEVELLDIVSK